MIITVKIRIADSVEAEEASGRTGQPIPKSLDIQVPNYLIDELSELASDELTKLGMGGLEFELVD
jgi:hypothetical protein